jgi:molybdopterin-containing oxidoreductase family membrane subunit
MPGGNLPERGESQHVLAPGHTFASVTDKISALVLARPFNWRWFTGFSIALALVLVLTTTLVDLLTFGPGVWGLDSPVMWAWDITNFVWWIGIGHAGTLISAILLLLKQEWRTSINRFAEAMTLFAVACAALFPLLHMGRPWFFYWTMPYFNTMALWPQWRSPLVWDVFAVSTYGTVSLLFWYVGLIPDLATLRDRASYRAARILYAIPALGWRGSAIHWHRYRTAYLLLAGLATPLVVSVHTVVSLDFASGIVPGWHSTIFPPYFVAGAIYSGFAMVMTLAIPLRKAFGLEDMITMKHLDNMAKVMLTTGLIVTYGYAMEAFFSYYSANTFEGFLQHNRMTGPYWHTYYLLILCNCITIQLMWFPAVRRNVLLLFAVAMVVNTGMWLERYVIIVTSLHREFIPAAWGMFHASIWDYGMFYGTIGLFFFLLFIFIRILPVISIAEMRELVLETTGRGNGHGALATSADTETEPPPPAAAD